MWWRRITPWLNLHNSYHITGKHFIHKIPPAPYSHGFHRRTCFKTENWKSIKVWREVVRANLASSLHTKDSHLYYKQHCYWQQINPSRFREKILIFWYYQMSGFSWIQDLPWRPHKCAKDRTGLTVFEPQISCFLTKFWCFNSFTEFQNGNRSPKRCDFTMRELLFIL